MRGSVAVLVLLLLAGCASSPPAADSKAAPLRSMTSETATAAAKSGLSIPSADWKPGYVFDFEDAVAGSAHMKFEQGGQSFENNEPISNRYAYSLEVLSTTSDLKGEPLYVLAMQDGSVDNVTLPSALLHGRTLVAVRQADLYPIHIYVHYPDCVAKCRPDRLDFEDSQSHYAWLRFPMTDGDQWSGTSNGGEEFGVLQVASQAHLPTIAEAHVDSIVQSVLATASLRQNLVDAGAKDVTADATLHGNRTVLFDTTRHASPKDTLGVDIHEDIHLKTPDGTPARMVLDIHLDLATTLKAAHLDERADPGLDSILDGLTLPTAPVPQLQLTINRTYLNAATQPVAKLTLSSNMPLDPDMQVSLNLTGPSGAVALTPKGKAYEAKFTEPGQFVAKAQVMRGGKVLSKTQLDVPVRYELDSAISCPDVTVDGVAACPTIPLPVRPGIAAIQIDATSDGLTAAPASGLAKMTATDADGKAASATFASGAASISATDLTGYKLDGRNWTLAYKPLVGHGDKFTFHILLSPTAEVTSTATSNWMGVAARSAGLPILAHGHNLPFLALQSLRVAAAA